MLQDKYDNIKFGQFQGYVEKLDYSEYRESEIDLGNIPMSYEVWMELNTPYPTRVITAGKDKTSTIGRIKSRLEVCDIINYTFDEETGECEIYYRATGESDMPYMIEAVKQNGEPVKYSGRDEQNMLNWLEEKFPVQPKRNPLSPPDWWLDNYTDGAGNCYSDADDGL